MFQYVYYFSGLPRWPKHDGLATDERRYRELFMHSDAFSKDSWRYVFKFLLDVPRWLPGRIMASISSSLHTSHKEVGGAILWLLYLMCAIICNLSNAPIYLT